MTWVLFLLLSLSQHSTLISLSLVLCSIIFTHILSAPYFLSKVVILYINYIILSCEHHIIDPCQHCFGPEVNPFFFIIATLIKKHLLFTNFTDFFHLKYWHCFSFLHISRQSEAFLTFGTVLKTLMKGTLSSWSHAEQEEIIRNSVLILTWYPACQGLISYTSHHLHILPE